MKPRFTLLTLLGVIAWVAVNAAALRINGDAWSNVAFFIWLAILVVAAIYAAQDSSGITVFARGMVLVTLVYGAATFVYRMVHFDQPPLPHVYVAGAIQSLTSEWPYPNDRFWFDPFAAGTGNLRIYLVAFQNVSLAFGLLGGSLALWRYRLLERRAKEKAE
ncbi:MAG: hypothetical protein SGJ19_07740 [Planctomycetia bacterium]|nr:hypothetical protein [Planctomycetia bacterium]